MGKRIILDGSSHSGKTSIRDYVSALMDGVRVETFLLNEMAMACRYRLDSGATFNTQWDILNNQIFWEQEYGKLCPNLIMDRGVYSINAYTRRTNATHEQKQLIETVVNDYVKIFPYDYVLYCEPIVSKNEKFRNYQSSMDKMIFEMYAKDFIPNVTLFSIPVFDPEATTKEEIKQAKIKRGEYVIEIMERIIK